MHNHVSLNHASSISSSREQQIRSNKIIILRFNLMLLKHSQYLLTELAKYWQRVKNYEESYTQVWHFQTLCENCPSPDTWHGCSLPKSPAWAQPKLTNIWWQRGEGGQQGCSPRARDQRPDLVPTRPVGCEASCPYSHNCQPRGSTFWTSPPGSPLLLAIGGRLTDEALSPGVP